MQTIEELLVFYKTGKYRALANGGVALRIGNQILQFDWNPSEKQYVMCDSQTSHIKKRNKKRKR